MAEAPQRLQDLLADRYRIERELGQGGMATVYLAHDLKHQRRVAIKVLDPELAAAIGGERFLREIETTASLRHPHILPLYDSGAAEGFLYYVMPHVEGPSLRDRLEREKQLPVEETRRITREVADALGYAHTRGVVHRDIKPENILLESGHAVIADFGIARAIHAAGGQTLTQTGAAVGSPSYMSPEQCAGRPDVDGRSDLYSLGCVLYEMLAGQPPFTSPAAESLFYQHLSVEPRSVAELRPSVPPGIARAVACALAKTPADRFSTASEFAAALAPTGEPVAGESRPETGPRRTRAAEQPVLGRGAGLASRRARSMALAVAVVAVGLVAVAAWQRWGPFEHRPGSAHPLKKEWILVAEFDGPREDSSLAVSTRDLVSAALDQSAVVATVPRDQIRTALDLAGKPPTTRVDAAVARELAYRKSVRAVVEGSISRLGEGRAIVVRVLDVERDSVLLSVSDVASNEKVLVQTIERVVKRVREGLGERRDAIRQSRDLPEVMTPSFEAFKAYQAAVQLHLAGDSFGAIQKCREVLALDPDFASAMNLMGSAYNNLVLVDSALAAWHEALRRPGRTGDVERLLAQSRVADLEGSASASLAVLDRLLLQYPMVMGAHNNRGYLLYRTGQYEAALGSLRLAEEASPFGANQIILLNRFHALLALGRLDEGREAARALKGEFARRAPVWIAAAVGDWAQAESLGRALEGPTTSRPEMRRLGALAIAAAAATRGEVRAAERALRRAERYIGPLSMLAAPISEQAAPRARLLLALVTGGPAAAPEGDGPPDTSASALVTRGLWAAVAGDSVGARRLLNTVRSRPSRELARAGADPELLEAWIASQGRRWEETLRLLGPAARQGSESGFAADQAGRVTLRWLVAGAWENTGRPDSATAYLELLLSPTGRVNQEYLSRGIAFSFAHRKLVLLYARLGRLEEARRHWEIFNETFTRPDPEMRPLIEEARAALVSAEGMATSARR